MKKRIVDIIWEEIARRGVRHAFTVTGGGAMYLVDALGRSSVSYICCHHEQSCSIAAAAYAIRTNGLGVCLVTAGPGGTNALTGCAAAYMDSTPVLFLSGQVKTADFASKRNVRQFGAQENDIVAMAKPVTKYAVLVEKPENVLYEVEKALFLAMHGRRGPVWVDIPLDVQAMSVDEPGLRRFDPDAEMGTIADPTVWVERNPDPDVVDGGVEKTLTLFGEARRPLILFGHGVMAAGGADCVREIAERLGVPLVATWRALGVVGHDHPLFFGSPGLQAPRYSNVITQGADFLLALGTRLDNMITAFSDSHFAFRAARKVIVDLDANETAKLAMPGVIPVLCDSRLFLERLRDSLSGVPADALHARYAPWRGFCSAMKTRFPLLREKQDKPLEGVDLYKLTNAVGLACTREDTIVVTSTSRSNTAGHMAFPHLAGQKSISSMGFGSMGFALPSALGAWFASGKKRVVVFEGDGSLHMNIQELHLLRQHDMNVKLFIFSNRGYAAIAIMQDRNFGGFRVGSDSGSGVTMPDLERLAAAYGIAYARIESDSELADRVAGVMNNPGAVLCEVRGDLRFDEIPKCVSSQNAQGQRVSAVLENPYPCLQEDELEGIFAALPGME